MFQPDLSDFPVVDLPDVVLCEVLKCLSLTELVRLTTASKTIQTSIKNTVWRYRGLADAAIQLLLNCRGSRFLLPKPSKRKLVANLWWRSALHTVAMVNPQRPIPPKRLKGLFGRFLDAQPLPAPHQLRLPDRTISRGVQVTPAEYWLAMTLINTRLQAKKQIMGANDLYLLWKRKYEKTAKLFGWETVVLEEGGFCSFVA